MNDAQTTGGYPRIACVIDADLWQLAQIRLGERVHFVQCRHEDALHARTRFSRFFEQLAWGLKDEG